MVIIKISDEERSGTAPEMSNPHICDEIEIEGELKWHDEDGKIYVGQFKDHKIHGKGVLI